MVERWIEMDCLLQDGLGLVIVSGIRQRLACQHRNLRIVGRKRGSLGPFRGRIALLLRLKHKAEVKVRFGKVGLRAQRCLEFLLGARPILPLRIKRSEIVVDLRGCAGHQQQPDFMCAMALSVWPAAASDLA